MVSFTPSAPGLSPRWGILHALREAVVHGADAEHLYEAALAEHAASSKLEVFAASIRTRWEHGHDVVVVHAVAAATDPELREEFGRTLERRRDGIKRLARTLRSQLRTGVDVERAVAILDALTLPEVYADLVVTHRWTPTRFEEWLAAALQEQLLGP